MSVIVIEALTKDGRNVLADLDGGLVTSGRVPRTQISPGDIVRHHGAWTAVTDVRHDGIHGITTAIVVDAAGILALCILAGSDSAEARTDTRIDPGTLYQIFAHQGEPEARADGEAVSVAFAWRQTITYLSALTFSAAAIRAAGHDPEDPAGILAWLRAGAAGPGWPGRIDMYRDYTGVADRTVDSARILPGPGAAPGSPP